MKDRTGNVYTRWHRSGDNVLGANKWKEAKKGERKHREHNRDESNRLRFIVADNWTCICSQAILVKEHSREEASRLVITNGSATVQMLRSEALLWDNAYLPMFIFCYHTQTIVHFSKLFATILMYESLPLYRNILKLAL